MSDLARLTQVSYASAHRELGEMKRLGWVTATRVGNALAYAPNPRHPDSDLLRRLVGHGQATGRRRLEAPRELTGEQTRYHLARLGAPLLLSGNTESGGTEVPAEWDADPPALEQIIAAGARLAHQDATVTRSLPLGIWKQRNRLNAEAILAEARRIDVKRSVGFFLELTGVLGEDPELMRTAQRFRDRRTRRIRPFFNRPESSYSRALAERNTPPVARLWHYRMNMGMDAFERLFREFASP